MYSRQESDCGRIVTECDGDIFVHCVLRSTRCLVVAFLPQLLNCDWCSPDENVRICLLCCICVVTTIRHHHFLLFRVQKGKGDNDRVVTDNSWAAHTEKGEN